MHPRFHLAMLTLLAAFLPAAGAGEVQVAVAANFAQPMAQIATAFTAATGHRVKVSTGATGKFYAQVISGAPFEVLVAADAETPRRLLAQGHGVAGTSFTYALGRLALWSATPGLVDPAGAVLASNRFRHIAVANPKLAPYGVAGFQVLQALGLAEKLAPKVVLGETIAQTYQFVATGNAEIGFVAWSQLNVPGRPVSGSHWLVPEKLHGEIRQDAVLLKAGEGNAAARALLAYLRSEPAVKVMAAFGYGRPAP